MSYFLLFIFSNVSFLAFMLAGSAVGQVKNKKESAPFSIMPSIPLLPLLVVFAVLALEKLGFSSILKITYIIHFIFFILSTMVIILGIIQLRNRNL